MSDDTNTNDQLNAGLSGVSGGTNEGTLTNGDPANAAGNGIGGTGTTEQPIITAAAPTGGTSEQTTSSDQAIASVAIPSDRLDAALAELNAIEQVALYWGGEQGIKIRNHVGRAKLLLEGGV